MNFKFRSQKKTCRFYDLYDPKIYIVLLQKKKERKICLLLYCHCLLRKHRVCDYVFRLNFISFVKIYVTV